MEGCHNEVALLQDDGAVLERRQHVDGVADAFDPRRADEDPAHSVVDPPHVEVGLEGVDLAAVGVASHLDIHQVEQRVPPST